MFAPLSSRPSVAGARAAYGECLSQCRPPVDPESGHDRCRAALIEALRHDGVEQALLARLNRALEAVEAELSDRT